MRYTLLLLVLLFGGCLRPDPVPPAPNPPAPVVDPVIVTDGKIKVLILYEEDDIPSLPTEQLLAIKGPDVRAWLTSHNADWRIWDQHINTKFSDQFWQDAVKLPRDSLPWIWITGSSGKGVKGPLPKSTAEVIDLLERHAK